MVLVDHKASLPRNMRTVKLMVSPLTDHMAININVKHLPCHALLNNDIVRMEIERRFIFYRNKVQIEGLFSCN